MNLSKPFLTTLLILFTFVAQAQFTKSSYLKPIEIKSGPRYYYGGKLLRNKFAALEIPLSEVNDPLVMKNLRAFRTTRTIGNIVGIIPTIYFIADRRQNYTSQTFFTSLLVSLGISVATNIVANSYARKSIIRYNLVIANPNLGVNDNPFPYQQPKFYQLTLQKKF